MGKLLLDLGQNVEAQFGRNEDALGVAGALFGLELVGAVRRADRDGQRVDAGLRHEIDHVGGVGIGVVLGRNLVLDAGQYAQLAFDRHVELVCVVDDLLREGYVLIVGRGEPSIITDEKPMSMQLLHSSNELPWSRCRQMGMFLPSSLAYSTAPCAM